MSLLVAEATITGMRAFQHNAFYANAPAAIRSPAMDTAKSQPIEIEASTDGAVIVRLVYPDAQRRKMARVLVGICVVLNLVPIGVGLGFHSALAALVTLVVMLSISYSLLHQFTAVSCSYILRASASELSIERTSWWRKVTRTLSRDQISDIVLEFSHEKGRRQLFKSWLTIERVTGRSIRCLDNVSGEKLAEVANALRTAMGMPPRSWP